MHRSAFVSGSASLPGSGLPSYRTVAFRSGSDDRSGLGRARGPLDRSAAGRCVLVVDDEPETVDAVVELIEGEGLTTLRAQNGSEALDLLQGGARPSLILLDLKMPKMDGWEFCRRLAEDEDLSGIPVAVVTASASVERVPERQNDAGFFVKPVNYRRLLELVKAYCG